MGQNLQVSLFLYPTLAFANETASAQDDEFFTQLYIGIAVIVVLCAIGYFMMGKK